MDQQTAGSAHSILNRKGCAFTYHHSIGSSTQYVMTDRYSEQLDSFGLAIIFDLAQEAAELYAYQIPRGELKAPPKPLHDPFVVQFKPGQGSRAVANALLKEIGILQGIDALSGVETLALSSKK